MLKALDYPLREEEAKLLDAGLAGSSQLRGEQRLFLIVRKVCATAGYASFKGDFIERVLERTIVRYVEWEQWLGISFRRVALAAIIVSLCCAYYNLSNHDTVDVAAVFGQPQPSIDQVLRMEDIFE